MLSIKHPIQLVLIWRRILFVYIIGFIAFLLSNPALAHDPFSSTGESQLPIILSAVLIFFLWLSYTVGAIKVWPGLRHWLLFQVTSVIICLTIFGPLDEWAETSTAAHMMQHMFMMVLIPPLWVLSKPLPQFKAFFGKPVVWLSFPLLKIVRYPMLAAALHAFMIWFWHAPKLYILALENQWWHVVEHACFLVTAGLFWWAVLRSTRFTAARAFLALLFTLMHTGFLGALLTFANALLYGPERSLQSQQLAGLYMWVLGGIPYLVAAFWCGQRWFQQVIRRSKSIVHE